MALLAFVPWLEETAALDALHSYGFGFVFLVCVVCNLATGTRLSWATPLRLARKTDNSGIVGSTTERDIPPICWVLDVLLEFVKNNIHVSLQIRLHTLVMSLFHRCLCYQKVVLSVFAFAFAERKTLQGASRVSEALSVGRAVEADVSAAGVCGQRRVVQKARGAGTGACLLHHL